MKEQLSQGSMVLKKENNYKNNILKKILKYRILYLFLIPPVIWFFVFGYIPMYGITLAFRDYRFDMGLWHSPWVGFRYVDKFFSYFQFWNLLRNSFLISFMKLLIGFPAPIILALLLNEVRIAKCKRIVQTVSYLPHFVSWVVVATIFTKFLSPHGGFFNDLRQLFGVEPIFYLGQARYFYLTVVFTEVWKGVGFGSIIYLAALSGINPNLYAAASIDGAGKWRSLLHITLPGLAPTISILLILSVGNLMKAGFEQILLFQTPATLTVSEILETYSLKTGLREGNISYATVVGLFQSLVSMALITTANYSARKFSGTSLW